jgi:hypothetical protein
MRNKSANSPITTHHFLSWGRIKIIGRSNYLLLLLLLLAFRLSIQLMRNLAGHKVLLILRIQGARVEISTDASNFTPPIKLSFTWHLSVFSAICCHIKFEVYIVWRSLLICNHCIWTIHLHNIHDKLPTVLGMLLGRCTGRIIYCVSHLWW